MAEAFGVVAGALGLISVLKEIKTGIDTLQQIRDNAGKVPSQIQSLTDDLEFLVIVLEQLAERHGLDHPILQHCKKCCDDVASRLAILQEKIPKLQGSKLKQFKFALKGLKVDLAELQTSLTRAKANMSLAAAIPVLAVLETTQIQAVPDGSPDTSSPDMEPSSLNVRRPIRRGCWAGSTRRCSCSCHSTSVFSMGFLTLEYTPIRQRCDNEACDSWTVGSSVNLGLTSFGLLWKVIIQAQISHRDGDTTLQPGLAIQRLVPEKSPGFKAITEFFYDHISLNDVKEKLATIAQNDPTFRNHVTPSGHSYLIHLFIACGWIRVGRNPAAILNLLSFMLLDLRLTRDLHDKRILALCRVVPNSPRHRSFPSDVLDHLVNEGFELLDAPWPVLGDQWPDFGTHSFEGDPTSMKFLSTIARHCPEFAGMTPLHDAALIGPIESVRSWVSRSPPNQRNFLGQTALHLSVSEPHKASVLIEAGFDLNAADTAQAIYPRTPLVYTAILGASQSAVLMIEAGADLNLSPYQYAGMGFIYTAACVRNWQYLLDIVPSIRARLGGIAAKPVIETMAVFWTTLIRKGASDHLFGEMLAVYGCANMTIKEFSGLPASASFNGNTLMHLICTEGRARRLLETGFTHINHVNEEGKSPLILACSGPGSKEAVKIAHLLIEAGADVHISDRHQHTALRHCLAKLAYGHGNLGASFSSKRQLTRMLLQAGADFFARDRCTCSCSPSGCPPFVAAHIRLPLQSTRRPPGGYFLPLTVLDFILLAWEWQGKQAARVCLLSALRLNKHNQLGMTHVCCWRVWDQVNFSKRTALADEDRVDILEEESEFTDLLDQEMDELGTMSMTDLEDMWFRQLKDDFNASEDKDRRFRDAKKLRGPFGTTATYVSTAIQAAVYKYGIVHEMFFGFRPTPEENRWQQWLRVRLGYLSRLLRALGIDLEDVSRKMPMLLRQEGVRKYEVEAVPEDTTEERRRAFKDCLDSWDEGLEADGVAELGGRTRVDV